MWDRDLRGESLRWGSITMNSSRHLVKFSLQSTESLTRFIFFRTLLVWRITLSNSSNYDKKNLFFLFLLKTRYFHFMKQQNQSTKIHFDHYFLGFSINFNTKVHNKAISNLINGYLICRNMYLALVFPIIQKLKI